MENTSKACINVVELSIKVFDAYLKLATILHYTWPRVASILHTFYKGLIKKWQGIITVKSKDTKEIVKYTPILSKRLKWSHTKAVDFAEAQELKTGKPPVFALLFFDFLDMVKKNQVVVQWQWQY